MEYERVRDIQEYVLEVVSTIAQKVRDGEEVVNLLDAMTRVEFYVKEALEAMNHPRNCDVGTAEEQASRFNKNCLCHNTGQCSSHCEFANAKSKAECVLRWAQMPHESEVAK